MTHRPDRRPGGAARGARALARDFRLHVAQTSTAPLGIVVTKAQGTWLTDATGRRYLDLLAGMGVVNLGHGNRAVTRACLAQLRRHLHVMVYGEYVLPSQVDLATRLVELAGPPFESCYFTSSGTEAVEGALKTARKHTGRRGLVGFALGFHGDTFGALSVGGNPVYRDPFLPLLPGTTILPWQDARALRAIDRRTAAVVIEPVQAEGGVRVADPAYLRLLRARCDEVGALLVFDEVVTGMGRTGALFAFQECGIRPDLLVLAKALGGGLPLGAFLASRRILATLAKRPALAHVTTFGGHPLSCAAALAALNQTIARDLPGRAAASGRAFLRGLQDLAARHPVIRAVRGAGLLLAVELATPTATRRFAAACLARGLLVNWTLHRDTVIRLAPPLVITRAEIALALATMEAALDDLRRPGH
ncbi:MAG: aspartate aminotransferase family protein [Deltaproteobacteria bacterium]|nr:aspartate aminotransferase family protein [Deltaproteobacteria bacterium]